MSSFVEGSVSTGYEPVKELFESNVRAGIEDNAQVCVYVDGVRRVSGMQIQKTYHVSQCWYFVKLNCLHPSQGVEFLFLHDMIMLELSFISWGIQKRVTALMWKDSIVYILFFGKNTIETGQVEGKKKRLPNSTLSITSNARNYPTGHFTILELQNQASFMLFRNVVRPISELLNCEKVGPLKHNKKTREENNKPY